METTASSVNCPKEISVEPGNTYRLCSCWHSLNQLFCDGSDKDTGFALLAYRPVSAAVVCERTATPPFCDGSDLAGACEGRTV
jgi:CDGSH-type Zn-finger protein